jgi:hypothetical protein
MGLLAALVTASLAVAIAIAVWMLSSSGRTRR